MSNVRNRSGTRLSFELLEARHLLTANPIITEFSATGNNYLHDGNGDTPDWIEIFNAGDQAIDLAGYHLTDDPTELNRWTFPSTTLASSDYLVVFASGNSQIDSLGYHHTNFSLASGGDYVALVAPDNSVISEFGNAGADYPPQVPGGSYGLGFESTTDDVITPFSSVRYTVPVDASDDSTWMQPGFDDTQWLTGAASVGFEVGATAYDGIIETSVPTGTSSVYVRLPFDITDGDALLDRLTLKYDDGFVAYLNGTVVASSNVDEPIAFDSQASSLRVREAAIEDVDFSLTEFSDLLVVGENVLAIHVLNAGPDDDLLLSANLSIASGMLRIPQVEGHFAEPTPGLPNANLLAGEISFSRSTGVFTDPFLLTIHSGHEGDTIRYTIDGTEPHAGSLLYSDATPLLIGASTQIRARAFGPDGRVGNVSSVGFTLADATTASFSSDLPVVVLENFAQGVPDRDFLDSYLSLYDLDSETGRSSFADDPDVNSLVAQRRRGATSYNWDKSNLRIELRDEQGDDRDMALLGMPAESDWILYGPYTTDRTLLRNSVVFELSEQMGNYAVRTRYVEMFSNTDGGALDADDYMGVYVLMETIKIDGDRVDIDSLDPLDNEEPDITGGYILKIDRTVTEEDAHFNTQRGNPPNTPVLVHDDPNRNELTAAQVDYIRGYLEEFEDALYGANYRDPEVGYAAYIDVDSWIDYHLLRTFTKEKDALVLSEHFYLPRDGRLVAGPVWDFDRSTGYIDNPDRGPEGWSWRTPPDTMFNYGWWGRLFSDPAFRQRWVDRWQELRETVFSDANLAALVQSHASQVAEAQARNFDRWPESTPNGGPLADSGLTGWEAEVSNFENWLTARAAWFDTRMPPKPQASHEGSIVSVGTEVTLTPGVSGTPIYYTLDGTDPREPDDTIAAGALLYSQPIIMAEDTHIVARAYDTSIGWRWSGPVEVTLPTETLTPATASHLRVSEIHYHPQNPSAAELNLVPDAVDNDFEFLELTNTSGNAIALDGLRFTDGIEFDFSTADIRSLEPGDSIVIVSNRSAFEARYPLQATVIAGEYTGSLSNSGERLTLLDAFGQTVIDFEYLDDPPWPTAADGDGPTLQMSDPRSDPALPANWVASAATHGSPGVAPPFLSGDYDRSGVVDADDFNAWRSQFGAQVSVFGSGADGNLDGVVDTADYTVWRDNLGAAIPASVVVAAEPEYDTEAPQDPMIDPSGDGWGTFAARGRSTGNASHASATDVAFATTDPMSLYTDLLGNDQDEQPQLASPAASSLQVDDAFAHWNGNVPRGHERLSRVNANSPRTSVTSGL